MSKRSYISRYLLILKKLRAKPYSSCEELLDYIDKQLGFLQLQDDTLNMGFSKRTLQRMIETFGMFNSLNLTQSLAAFTHLEKGRPQGTENLGGLIHAIKNKLQIKFDYQELWEDEITERTAEPYALKEFKNRWYVLAKDCKDGEAKSFTLDRLANLEITGQDF